MIQLNSKGLWRRAMSNCSSAAVGVADGIEVDAVDPARLDVIGVERDGGLQVRARLVIFPAEDVNVAEQPARPAIGLVEQDGALRQGEGRRERLPALLDPAEDVVQAIGPAELRMRQRALGVELDRLLRQPLGLGVVRLAVAQHERFAAQHQVIGRQGLRAEAQGALAPGGLDAVAERGGDGADDVVLQRQDVGGIAVEVLGPEMSAARSLDQLGGDAQAPPMRRTLPSTR